MFTKFLNQPVTSATIVSSTDTERVLEVRRFGSRDVIAVVTETLSAGRIVGRTVKESA